MKQLKAEAERIVRTLRKAGHEAYFAGGCVRDMLMRIEPRDFDIATDAPPEQVMGLFPKTNDVGAQFGVVLVHTDVADFEVAAFRSDQEYSDGRHPDAVTFCSAREDVLRRDFTVNGMLYDPVEDQVIDWVDGRADIERRIVRTIGEPDQRFEEDKLRLLRAVRFAARLEYAIDKPTYEAMIRHAPGLTQVSPERIRAEIMMILTSANAGRGLRIMHDTGLLAQILPEVEAMVGVAQPPLFHPEGDVFEHTCLMFDKAGRLSPELAAGILLHDVGKPGTQAFEDRIRFNEHDREGAELAKKICRRLRFSNEQTDRITALVANHMRFAMAMRMKLSKLKMLLGLPHFEEHLELHRVDCVASHGKLDVYDFIVKQLRELPPEEISPEPLISGHDLKTMGYSPGPIFSRILAAVAEEQLEGRLAAAEGALAWVRKRFPME